MESVMVNVDVYLPRFRIAKAMTLGVSVRLVPETSN